MPDTAQPGLAELEKHYGSFIVDLLKSQPVDSAAQCDMVDRRSRISVQGHGPIALKVRSELTLHLGGEVSNEVSLQAPLDVADNPDVVEVVRSVDKQFDATAPMVSTFLTHRFADVADTEQSAVN